MRSFKNHFQHFLKEKISFEQAKFAKREISFHLLEKKKKIENATFLEEPKNLGGRLGVF